MTKDEQLIWAYLAGMQDAAQLVLWREGVGTDKAWGDYILEHIHTDATINGMTAVDRARDWAAKSNKAIEKAE